MEGKTWPEKDGPRYWWDRLPSVCVKLLISTPEAFDVPTTYMQDWENEIRRELTSANPEREINCLFVNILV
jgi:hypothetical protein